MTNGMAVPPEFAGATQRIGVTLTAEQQAQVAAFVDLFLEASAQFNLTAVRDPQEVWSRHVLDSLSLLPLLEAPAGARVVDVGSGGGLPGLLLAIGRPDLTFSLVDATGKKVRHIAALASKLGLQNVQAVHGRAETLTAWQKGPAEHREVYAVAVARALAPLPVLLELVVPFLRVHGMFLAIKGERAAEELLAAKRALDLLHVQLEAQRRTPTGTVLCLRKTAATPRKYPRRPGEPKRLPL